MSHVEVIKTRPVEYYWAYGSNLCHLAMKKRCPDATPVAKLMVPNGNLVFRGVADVNSGGPNSIPGGLWKITPRCERALDGYEGVKISGTGKSIGLYHKRYLLLRIHGVNADCLFYQMNDDEDPRDATGRYTRGIFPPSENYLSIIEQGYKDFGLPLDYLNRAVMNSWEDKSPTWETKARHERKGRPALAGAPIQNMSKLSHHQRMTEIARGPKKIAAAPPRTILLPYDKRGG